MKMTLTETSFIRAINELFPSRKNYYSYNGLQTIWSYIEQYEEDTGQETEFDYIEMCGIYDEFDSLKELEEQHNLKRLKSENRVIEFEQWTNRNTGEYLRKPTKSFIVIS
jgi:adenine C2-methylase RlmN of 23S rRNA A2503 and tRNA A37